MCESSEVCPWRQGQCVSSVEHRGFTRDHSEGGHAPQMLQRGIVFLAIIFFFVYLIFTGFPAGTVQIRGHQQLQQKISNLSVLVASQMVITSYHFGGFEVPP